MEKLGWQVFNYSSDIWNIVLLYLIWTVRKERNWCTFEDVESTNLHLFLMSGLVLGPLQIAILLHCYKAIAILYIILSCCNSLGFCVSFVNEVAFL